jgi:hypothetical protein
LQSDLSVGRNARAVGSEVEFLVKNSEFKKPNCFEMPKGFVRFEKEKFQISNSKSQTNSNSQYSKFQTP